mmetsp:Transcript_52630/g.133586  ORF Transcript_52630/g.133586 Transcript_52630/m.133586 type:complete len:210 (+) Transcript_52630:102-731(+)
MDEAQGTLPPATAYWCTADLSSVSILARSSMSRSRPAFSTRRSAAARRSSETSLRTRASVEAPPWASDAARASCVRRALPACRAASSSPSKVRTRKLTSSNRRAASSNSSPVSAPSGDEASAEAAAANSATARAAVSAAACADARSSRSCPTVPSIVASSASSLDLSAASAANSVRACEASCCHASWATSSRLPASASSVCSRSPAEVA